jgi:hypothetical protein
MKTLTLGLLAATLTLSCVALNDTSAKKVTVAQLEQMVTAADGQPDAVIAQRLAELNLTERLNSASLAKLKGYLQGDRARQALEILADQSAFLGVPGAEIPQTPLPDQDTQRRIMTLVVNYVTKTVHQLPNFLATRNTTRFEDSPAQGTGNGLPLHSVSRSSVPVVYRDGQEMADSGLKKARKHSQAIEGLASWGEFGPILSTVLLDAAKSDLTWSHWESSGHGLDAVFRYRVPTKSSHYQVQFCCVTDNLVVPSAADPLELRVFHEFAAYHGEISVDPSTGAILRITVEAELAPGEPLTKAAIVVDYAAIQIGGKTFNCPVRSLALAQKHDNQDLIGARPAEAFDRSPLKTFLNEVLFDGYQRLGSETHILTADTSESNGGQVSSDLHATNPAGLQPLSVTSMESPKAGVYGESPAEMPTSGTPTKSPVTVSPSDVDPEIVVGAANGVPDKPTFPDSSSKLFPNGTKQHATVGVVVYDHTGHPVKDLKQADFEVFDSGHKVVIDSFSQSSAEDPDAPSAAVERADRRTTTPNATPALNSGFEPTILLIDENNITSKDLIKAREQINTCLATIAARERIGLYVIDNNVFQI